MKKIEFNVGDKIVTIKNGELRKGVIKNFYPVNPPVFAIEFEDGTVEKIPYNNVAPEPKTETPEEENAPVVKSEITITPDEFQKIAIDVITDYAIKQNDITVGFVPTLILADIHKRLFITEAEND